MLFLEASREIQALWQQERRHHMAWEKSQTKFNHSLGSKWAFVIGFAKDPRSFHHSLVTACPELPDGRRGAATGKMLLVVVKVFVSHKYGEKPIPNR